ncbi:hypothetical protein [Burkholderia cenocepacia]|uniref:hypothetical protein n=1 Tax=Burkholderia cenocepacia TaxID=95486 RepID=UPI00351C99F4
MEAGAHIVARHRGDRILHRLPQRLPEMARDARRGPALPLPRQRERIAGQIAGLHEPREHHVQDHQRLPLAGCRQRPVKRPPARIVARMLAAAVRAPQLGRRGREQELPVHDEILVRERRQRLAARDHGPQQQAFGFLAVVLERGRRIDEAREPGAHGVEVMGRGDLRMRAARAVGARASVERGRHGQRIDRQRAQRGVVGRSG